MTDDTSSGGGGDDSTQESSPGAPDGHDSDTTQNEVAAHRNERGFDDPTERDRRIGIGERSFPNERSDDGDEYRIPLDLSETPNEGETDATEDDPYGPEPSSTPIEPGEPALENVLFVFLGAVAMVLVIFRVVSIPL
ncbi:DUF7312 domain-containing protein [Natronorubrum thiooxidans]|uniref:DUF7312 domain-containing protein n=1 Tax=Natronorubrum thiooxidans TaxID=308853 RepID=A0A1N7F6M9_9EURY|nr:hypothetical protein [Natronorubrum thiooxidans]SIR96001.1 hypothetical protein SAMN05421752_10632 [Natronorubrum thiooxidans]